MKTTFAIVAALACVAAFASAADPPVNPDILTEPVPAQVNINAEDAPTGDKEHYGGYRGGYGATCCPTRDTFDRKLQDM
ncbi:hypothetical protein BBJ29_003214 [Phytophthora kernoviae]|uniref:RxLR effector protein n=1 Tax=Phytophthora kernoviae TaxID=325452 RepID=A0A3F2RVG0_9STRA|nr:hypothetical protein BBJ29_003214 [Phytophthora kernoviae]RLN64529.1 hypothetical protein BBP00_00003400 [Phytophthora kernoviae]